MNHRYEGNDYSVTIAMDGFMVGMMTELKVFDNPYNLLMGDDSCFFKLHDRTLDMWHVSRSRGNEEEIIIIEDGKSTRHNIDPSKGMKISKGQLLDTSAIKNGFVSKQRISTSLEYRLIYEFFPDHFLVKAEVKNHGELDIAFDDISIKLCFADVFDPRPVLKPYDLDERGVPQCFLIPGGPMYIWYPTLSGRSGIGIASYDWAVWKLDYESLKPSEDFSLGPLILYKRTTYEIPPEFNPKPKPIVISAKEKKEIFNLKFMPVKDLNFGRFINRTIDLVGYPYVEIDPWVPLKKEKFRITIKSPKSRKIRAVYLNGEKLDLKSSIWSTVDDGKIQSCSLEAVVAEVGINWVKAVLDNNLYGKASFYVRSNWWDYFESHIPWMIEHQQSKKGMIEGAFQPIDTLTLKPAGRRAEEINGESLFAGTALATYLRFKDKRSSNYGIAKESLQRYLSFLSNVFLDPSTGNCAGFVIPEQLNRVSDRICNYTFAVYSFLECYRALHEPAILQKALKTLKKIFSYQKEDGGVYRERQGQRVDMTFWTHSPGMIMEVFTLLNKEKANERNNKLKNVAKRMADHLVEMGEDYPAFEAFYGDQSHTASFILSLSSAYLWFREREYQQPLTGHVRNLFAQTWFVPLAPVNGNPIRWWDGYWLGTHDRGSITSPQFLGGWLQPVALVSAYRVTKNIDYLKKAYLAMGNALYLFDLETGASHEAFIANMLNNKSKPEWHLERVAHGEENGILFGIGQIFLTQSYFHRDQSGWVAVNAGLTSNAKWITARLYSSFPRYVFIHSEILKRSYQLETDNDILSFKIRDREKSGILMMVELKKRGTLMLLCEEKMLVFNDIQVTGEYESVKQEQNEKNENILVIRKVSRVIIEIKG